MLRNFASRIAQVADRKLAKYDKDLFKRQSRQKSGFNLAKSDGRTMLDGSNYPG